MLFVGWRIVTGVVAGVSQLFGVAGNAATSQAPPGIQLQQVYVVSSGDTLNAIASRFGIPERQIIKRNHISNPNKIYTGERLIVPAPYNPKGTRQMIVAAAQRFKINPYFALGLAYQESGFNENVVSSTNAIGVMQVEPDTAKLVATDLGRSFNLGIASDNITVGVYWLAYMVHTYHGHERMAAAAYYEGMGNLAQHGYLVGTQQYVDNVMALKRAFASGNPPA
jgi:soluble lytic murein transglycosylase-like protein